MKDPTAVKRNASYRQRKQEAGLVLLQVWVRPEDREKVRKYAGELKGNNLRDTSPNPM